MTMRVVLDPTQAKLYSDTFPVSFRILGIVDHGHGDVGALCLNRNCEYVQVNNGALRRLRKQMVIEAIAQTALSEA